MTLIILSKKQKKLNWGFMSTIIKKGMRF